MFKCHILVTDIRWTSFFSLFAYNVLLIEKPGSDLHLQNVWTHLLKSIILSNDTGQWPASFLKAPLLRRCFSHILLVQIRNPVFP